MKQETICSLGRCEKTAGSSTEGGRGQVSPGIGDLCGRELKPIVTSLLCCAFSQHHHSWGWCVTVPKVTALLPGIIHNSLCDGEGVMACSKMRVLCGLSRNQSWVFLFHLKSTRTMALCYTFPLHPVILIHMQESLGLQKAILTWCKSCRMFPEVLQVWMTHIIKKYSNFHTSVMAYKTFFSSPSCIFL